MSSRNVSNEALAEFLSRSNGTKWEYRLAFDLKDERTKVERLEKALTYAVGCWRVDSDLDYVKRILNGEIE